MVPCSWRGPAALPAVHRYYRPSGHPPAFSAVTSAYLAPGSFSPGPGGLHRFRIQTFLTCCRHYPAGTEPGFSQISKPGAAFASNREAQLPEFSFHEACSTFDTYGPQGRFLGLAQICQMAPPPAFACKASSQLHDSDSCHGRTFTCWFGPSCPVTAVTVTVTTKSPNSMPRSRKTYLLQGVSSFRMETS